MVDGLVAALAAIAFMVVAEPAAMGDASYLVAAEAGETTPSPHWPCVGCWP